MGLVIGKGGGDAGVGEGVKCRRGAGDVKGEMLQKHGEVKA